MMEERCRRFLAVRTEAIMKRRGLSRPEAEREAFSHLVVEFLNLTHPNADPARCAQCGGPGSQNDVLLPIGVGARHTWLHGHCWESWRARRRAEVEKELAQFGIVKPVELEAAS
jgi:hypothetical protein